MFRTIAKWLSLCLLVGTLAGAASALFLYTLGWATEWREAHPWIIALLPLGGLTIGLAYHYWGDSVVKGNNLILEEFYRPVRVIPFRMAPLVFFGTIATHLFGGSAGREGTAIQLGGAIADRFTHWFRLGSGDRKTLLTVGVSAGFASVFGTPLAGAVFALEIVSFAHFSRRNILPSFLAAYVAHYVCLGLGALHTHYPAPPAPALSGTAIGWTLAAGLLFGLTALLFSGSIRFFARLFGRIQWPPLRPFVGGIVLALAVWALGTTEFIGLGLPTISAAFSEPLPTYDFIAKLLFTAVTLGAGFKGGEVTPLFFVGATLGNVLASFIPLPAALLASMGFVAVFAGATNTPLACTAMGLELFGLTGGIYIALACLVSYIFSGRTGIYGAQEKSPLKNGLYRKQFPRSGNRQF